MKMLLLSLALLAGAAACGGGPDTLDVTALKEGQSTKARLKFWMKELGSFGGKPAENIHLDDAKNVRVVLYHDAAMAGAIDKLAQNKVYTVTFTPTKKGPFIEGTLGAIE